MMTIYSTVDQTIQSVTPHNVMTPSAYSYPANNIFALLNLSSKDPNSGDSASTSNPSSSIVSWLMDQALGQLPTTPHMIQQVKGYQFLSNLVSSLSHCFFFYQNCISLYP